ncbi:MAG: hypothetical protein QOD92_485 [Acidimicrobiaceae bacterium]|jgi:hypothetical protein
MNDQSPTAEARPYIAPAIASRQRVEALLVDSAVSDSPVLCCA